MLYSIMTNCSAVTTPRHRRVKVLMRSCVSIVYNERARFEYAKIGHVAERDERNRRTRLRTILYIPIGYTESA